MEMAVLTQMVVNSARIKYIAWNERWHEREKNIQYYVFLTWNWNVFTIPNINI